MCWKIKLFCLAALCGVFFLGAAGTNIEERSITRESQMRCGIDAKVNITESDSLLTVTVLIPFSACPEGFLVSQVFLEVYEKKIEAGSLLKPLVVCPLANLTGCEVPGESLEMRFLLDEKTLSGAYVVIIYGKEKGVKYRLDLESYFEKIKGSSKFLEKQKQ